MKKQVVHSLLLVLTVMFILVSITGCNEETQVSSSGAKQIDPPEVPKNSKGNTTEQQNIHDRIAVTTDPTKVMWIHLITLEGKILTRMPVRCKITSSGKRLEAVRAADSNGYYPNSNVPIPGTTSYYETDELMQADGTFGESDPYVYWFDPMGRYHQWGTAGGLGYLLTDYPIDLTNPQDEITGMYNASKAASEWQKLQEEKLRKQELSQKRLPPQPITTQSK